MPDGEPSGSVGSNGLFSSIGWRRTFFSLSTLKMLLDFRIASTLGVRIDRKRRAFAHRQQACDRIDLAVGQDDAGDRTVTQPAGRRMKLRGRDQLLAQIGRGIDQEPVLAVGADRNRSLGASEFGMLVPRCPANRTSAIPLRNTTTCRGAQDDDAKHDPSPGISNVSSCGYFRPTDASGGRATVPTRSRCGTCHAWRSTCVKT